MSDLRVMTPIEAWLTGIPMGQTRPAPPERTPFQGSDLRRWIAPVALMASTPFLSILFWIAIDHHGGSLGELAQAGPASWWSHVPAPSLWAVKVVALWTAFQLLLLRWLPGEEWQGPVTPAGVRPTYKLNGVSAWLVSHAVLLGGWWLGALDVGSVYERYGELLMTLLLFAFGFCAFLYWKGRNYPSSPDAVYTGEHFFDFFQGIELHPRVFGINLKQLINCRVSMMGWSAVFMACAIAQYEQQGFLSTSMKASVFVLVFYLYKFFVWEGGYFASMDIQHDRFGYYICWGVLVWVPAVYCLPALWLVEHPIQWHPLWAGVMVAIGLLSIRINYEADRQRQRVRQTHGKARVWGKKPELIHAKWTAEDGQERESILLVSGWWGVSRHFHYVPELGLAAAWILPAGFTHFLPWFYWVFLFILLMDRARRDELRCAAKYGEYWKEYERRVPYRVLPGVY